MVLRQLPAPNSQEQGKQVMESVDLARQAVQMDVTDGTSWSEYSIVKSVVSKYSVCTRQLLKVQRICDVRFLVYVRLNAFNVIFIDILGNAYVSVFFTCGQDPQFVQKALSAYAQSVSIHTSTFQSNGPVRAVKNTLTSDSRHTSL